MYICNIQICKYIHPCMRACMPATHAHMHTSTPAHTHIHIYISIYICTQTHTHTHTHIHTYTHTHGCTRIHTHTDIHTYIHTFYILTYIHTCIHMYICVCNIYFEIEVATGTPPLQRRLLKAILPSLERREAIPTSWRRRVWKVQDSGMVCRVESLILVGCRGYN